jgi:hypothetical protein
LITSPPFRAAETTFGMSATTSSPVASLR